MDDVSLLNELTDSFEALLERHLAASKEWFPHELVPWGRGRDFEPGWEWSPEEHPLPEAVRSALVVNLLTEDNLPYYFQTLGRVFPLEAWQVWAKRWTAEEGRHAMVIRDYLTVTRAVDPVALERARMVQVAKGETPQPADVPHGLAYLAVQELATRISHRRTGAKLGDPMGRDLMARVGADENLHYIFYRDLASAALEVDPSAMVIAIASELIGFRMPGTGIPGFVSHAKRIAAEGIYDFEVHYEQIAGPVVRRYWRLEELTGLSPQAERARDAVLSHLDRLSVAARHLAERRASRRELEVAGMA
ncbi:MAG: acyl-ACP desaturase [Acidimicrobiales bacterium]